MHVQPIGTGGAFDELETAYIVNDTILIDCGPSAIKRTFADGRASKITHVFLSHIHNDHIGGFETLYYFKKYVSGNPLTEVYCPGEYFKICKNLPCMAQDVDKMSDFKFKFNFLAQYRNSFAFIDTPYGQVAIQPFKVVHSSLEAYGFTIMDKASGKLLILSGDTNTAISVPSNRFDLMFHDIGWEGLPIVDHKVHPTESEVVESFGLDARIFGIHTNTRFGSYPRAEVDRIYQV